MNQYEYMNGLVGIPYEDNGRDRNGVDCYGLVMMVAKDLFNTELPDWKVDVTSRAAVKELMEMKEELQIKQAASEIDKPEDWCVVVVERTAVLPFHMGIYLAGGVIHSSRTDGVIFQKMSQFQQENGKDNMRYWRWLPLIS